MNFEYFISAFAGVDVDWQIGVTTTDTYYSEQPGRLIGGDDELILETSDGRILNAVQWDETWPYEEGVAMQLSRGCLFCHIQYKQGKLVLGARDLW